MRKLRFLAKGGTGSRKYMKPKNSMQEQKPVDAAEAAGTEEEFNQTQEDLRKMLLPGVESNLNILYEDNHIIVVVKSRNMPSQADRTGDIDLLTFTKQYIKLKYNKPGNVYLALVHRLDRPTGGVMMFAKTEKSAGRLSEQLREGLVQKKYLAVVVGVPRQKAGRLKHYLFKDEKNNKVKAHVANVPGSKLALLDYRVLETVDGLTLVDITLITGRSHQARVQMASLGCPLYADHKYSPPGKTVGYGKPLALWAYSLVFAHPVKNDARLFRALPPVEEAPWHLFNLEKHVSNITPL